MIPVVRGRRGGGSEGGLVGVEAVGMGSVLLSDDNVRVFV